MLLKGVAASRGILISPALVLGGQDLGIKRAKISAQSVESEIAGLQQAVAKTKEQLLDLKRKVAMEIGQKQAEIFNAHILFLEDPSFLVETNEQIRRERVSAEWSVWQFVERYAKLLSEV